MKIYMNTGGLAETNAYLVVNEATKAAAIVDAPEGTTATLIAIAKQNGYDVQYLLLTHGHWDHISDHAVVAGPRALTGTCVEAPDLRGGAALAIAALAAEGITAIGGRHHIDRGYENFIGKLRSLGAAVGQTSVEAAVEQASTLCAVARGSTEVSEQTSAGAAVGAAME